MEGGWIPVVRAQGRSGSWRTRASSGVFTVFVDNLPVSLNPKGLFKLFTKFGVIKDVFIPKKRRRITNTRFGFVRFDCVVAARVAVQKANGLWVDDRSLQVKHAEFGKVKVGDEAARRTPAVQGRRPVPQVNGGGVGRGGATGFRDQRSYAQAVAGGRATGLGGIYLKAEEVGNGWLFESVVIRLKAAHAAVNLKKELEGIGLEDILVRDSGGRDVVITFRSKEERVLKLPSIKELILEWCEDIVEGKPGQVLEQERCVWLSCYGIPLHLWNGSNVRRLGEVWGLVLCFDGDMSQPSSFACAKVKVSTKSMEPINSVVNLECRGVVFPVRVCEEQVVTVRSLNLSCRCNEIKDAAEIASSNTLWEHSVGCNRRDAGDDDADKDVVAESAAELEVGHGVSQEIRPAGRSRSVDVVRMVGQKSAGEAKVARHDGEKVMSAENCTTMMKVRNQRIGSTEETFVNQSEDFQLCMPGFVRSLDGSSPGGPGINIEVCLGQISPTGQVGGLYNSHFGLSQQDLFTRDSPEEGLPDGRLSSLSEAHEVEPSINVSRLQKGKKKVTRRSKPNQHLLGSKSFDLLRKYGSKGASTSKAPPRAAVWRAAVAASSLSASIEGGVDKGRTILNEAEATLKMGELLGLQFNGKRAELLEHIVDLELRDKDRIEGGVRGGV